MKKIVLIVLLVTLGNYATAQGGLRDLKNKAKNKIDNSTKSSSSVDSKGILKAKEIEGEAQEQIDLLNGYFSNDNINNVSTETIEETVYQLQSKLSTLQSHYSEKSTKLGSIEAEYAKYKELSTKEYAKRDAASEASSKLSALSSKADYVRKDGISSSRLVNFSEYQEAKDTYTAQGINDESTTKYVENLEDYFNNYIPNVFAKELKADFLNSDYFIEESWMKFPKTAISKIETVLEKDIEEYRAFSKQTDWIDELTQMLKEQKVKLIDYRDNGGSDAFKEKEKREQADNVFPSKSASNDASVISVVKKYHDVEHSGTIKKIIISSDWMVKKNEIGIPLEKYILVEVVSTLDGECYLNEGRVFRTYEGAGTYGTKKLSFYTDSDLMNCNNY